MERDSQIGIQWAWESQVMYARDRYARNREGEVGFKAKGISWIKTKRTAAPQGKQTGELV